jgi:excisionase family DNA binding protein
MHPEPPSPPPECDLVLELPTTLGSVPTVAQRLDVSEKSIRRYIKRGRLKAYRIEGQIRISDEDLRVFLVTCRIKSNMGIE